MVCCTVMYAKSPKKSKNLLTNSKECRIINKLTHREQEKTKKKASKAQEKGIKRTGRLPENPEEPKKENQKFFKKPLDKANEI